MSARGRSGKPQPKGGRGRPANRAAKKVARGRGKGQPQRPRRGEGQRGTTPIRTPDEGRGGGHLGGDQIEGRHAVRELLMAGTRRTREVILAGDLDPAPILDDIIDLADEQKVTIRELSRSKFESMTRTDGAGVLATAQPLRPIPLDERSVRTRRHRSSCCSTASPTPKPRGNPPHCGCANVAVLSASPGCSHHADGGQDGCGRD